MRKEIERRIKELKNSMQSIKLINEKTKKHEHERNLFYQELKDIIAKVKKIPILDDHLIGYPNLKNFDKEIANIMLDECNSIFDRLKILLKLSNFDLERCKLLNIYFSNLKCFFDNLGLIMPIDNKRMLKKRIDEKIDSGLKKFKKKKGKSGGQAISKLGTILNSDPVCKIIISKNKKLEGFLLALFNDKVQKNDINYVLENLTGDSINI
jgi:hypothetical protein